MSMISLYTTIQVEKDDDAKMMSECVRLYLKAHREMLGVPITRRKMFKELVRYYIEG